VRVRADAVRNRARILDAARALVAETGVDAPVDEVARRAGVAVGTLYRHFPAKDDLLAAVVADSTERIAVLAEAALAEVDGGAPPGAVLDRLFRAVAEGYATDRVVKAATGRLEVPVEYAPEPGSPAARAAAGIEALLDRARAAGAVRPDVDLTDLVLLLEGLPGATVPAPRRARYLDVVLAGLRPAPSVGSEP
jgi:AcrR family transcriptional regulator